MFLDNLLRASIEGGIAIIVLYLGLKAFPSIPPNARVWLWRIIFAKLALSLLPLGSIPLKVLPPVEESATQPTEVYDNAPIPANTSPLNPWLCAWITGVGVAAVLMVQRAGTSRAAIASAHDVNSADLDQLANRAGIKTPRLLISPTAPTALVIGFQHPTILLSQDVQASEDSQMIVAHEIAHIVHRDLQWNALISTVQVLFFFHPLVWLATRSLYQAQESAADALAIQLTDTTPKRYGQMLLRATLSSSKLSPTFFSGLPIGGSTADIRGRLKDLRFVNARLTVARIAFLAVLTCAVVAMTPAYRLQEKDAPKSAIQHKHAKSHAKTSPRHARSYRYNKSRGKTYTIRTRRGGRTYRLAPQGARAAIAPAAPAVVISEQAAPAVAPTAPRAITIRPAAIARGTAPIAAVVNTVPPRPSAAPRVARNLEYKAPTITPPTPAAVGVEPVTAPPVSAAPAAVSVGVEPPAAIAAPNVQTHAHRVKHVSDHGKRVGIGYGYGRGVGVPALVGAAGTSFGGHGASHRGTVSNNVHVKTAKGSGSGHGSGQSSSSSGGSGN